MTTSNSQQGSAKIYEFPAGGRRGLAERRDRAKLQAMTPVQPSTEGCYGEAWYHEAAIRESEPARKP